MFFCLYIFKLNIWICRQNQSTNFQCFSCPTAKTAPLSVPALQATMREPALQPLRQQDSNVCVRVCVCECVRVCLLSIEHMLKRECVDCMCRFSAVWIRWCESQLGVWVCVCLLLSGWMSEGELGVGGWDEIQSMDLEIPQDHPVMLLN